MTTRRYRYIGPAEPRDQAATMDTAAVDTSASPAGWLATRIVGLDGVLRLAPRRSEHVALAAGQDVLAAGEITFACAESGWYVEAVSNQSTGYCPDPDCWPAVANALDRAGIPHPGTFTDTVVFRRRPACGRRNIIRDNDFTCAVCETALPPQWNFN